jgi:membrane protein DedA with SNARE-associated domain
MLIHQMHLLAGADPVLAAGVLGTIGKAIFWIFAVVFIIGGLVGLLIGFFVGRTVGRKQSPASQQEGAGSDAEQLTG